MAQQLYRGQGNQAFRTAEAVPQAKRGQTVPYDVNGSPSGVVGDGDKGDIVISGGVWVVKAGAGQIITVTAGETINGHRAAYVASDGMAYNADRTTAACRLLAGLSVGAALVGAQVTVQVEGVIVEPSWAWSGLEIVWLSTAGQLTQTVPTSAGYLMQVGVPLGPTRLRIEPQLVAKV